MASSNLKIAVTGANGQLGTDIVSSFEKNGNSVISLDHSKISIDNMDSVRTVLNEIRPDVVVNTAAMHNVDKCEEQPEHAYAVNGVGSRNLALIANDIDALLIHISTDYVFDGLKGEPYLESDVPIPVNVYGNTKLAGEHYVRGIAEKYHILRVSGIYGHSPCRAKGLNFVELMLKLGTERDEVRVVNDETVSPTSTADIARQVVQFAEHEGYGLYHLTAEGSCTWYQFAQVIFEMGGVNTNLNIADPSEFPMKVPRPKYSVLENAELKKNNLKNTLHWEEGLQEYLDSRG